MRGEKRFSEKSTKDTKKEPQSIKPSTIRHWIIFKKNWYIWKFEPFIDLCKYKTTANSESLGICICS
jgi:hypothetical protein